MTMITDLSLDLVEEILSKVPLTSLKAVKSTCKRWNTLSKDESFTKKHSAEEFPAFLNFDYCCSQRRFSVHRIHYNIEDLPCIKEIGKLHSPIKLHILHQCDGLLLGHAEDKLVVWNPSLAQTRWIELRNKRSVYKRRGLGRCAIGYDNNKNHKVLVRFYDVYDNNITNVKHEIYDFKSSSWRGHDIINPKRIRERGVSVKGNNYFVVEGKLLGFDFTKERFGPFMDLPFESSDDFEYDRIPYSCVRGDQLAVLFQRHLCDLVIWITTKIEPDAVSWSNFFKFDLKPFLGFDHGFKVRSFFIDKEKKIGVVCGTELKSHINEEKCYVVGEDGCYQAKTGKQYVFSYVPSWVQIQVPSSCGKRKGRDC
ncbi:F-box protein At1g59680-like [Brassica napus]|nr:PREDICTED: F-box protein At1g59680-like [Brassica oleracea var. oleracea]XP_048612007.1 F-box protein At1g59680-like [Brassica napus]